MFEHMVFTMSVYPFPPQSLDVRWNGSSLIYTHKPFPDSFIQGVFQGDCLGWVRRLEDVHIEQWTVFPIKVEIEDLKWSVEYKEKGKEPVYVDGSEGYPLNWDELIDLAAEILGDIDPKLFDITHLDRSK